MIFVYISEYSMTYTNLINEIFIISFKKFLQNQNSEMSVFIENIN